MSDMTREEAISTAEGEYIKKEDALNAIRKSSHYGRTQKIYVCHREVVDSIDDLPTYSFPNSAKNKGEWIPVSERLPKDDTDVVILTEMGTVGSCHYFEGFNNYPNCSRDYIFDDVVAWLPIPEPYKKGE